MERVELDNYKIVEKMTKSDDCWREMSRLKLHIFLKSGLQVAGWVFKDDKVYLIVVEGFEKTIIFTPYVENTWSLDGTGAVTRINQVR